MAANGIKKIVVYLFFASIAFGQSFYSLAGDNGNSLEEIIPHPVYYLSNWPSQETIKEKMVVDLTSIELISPRRLTNDWIKDVLDPSFQPPENVETYFLRGEIENRDIVRMKWKTDDYNLVASLTHNIFVIRVIPILKEGKIFDEDQKIEYVKKILRKLFIKTGIRYDSQCNRYKVENLPELIIDNSIQKDKIITLNNGNLCGTSKYIGEKGEKCPMGIIKPPIRKEENGIISFASFSEWQYWYNSVSWFYENEEVCFYFLNLESISVYFTFENDSQNWFEYSGKEYLENIKSAKIRKIKADKLKEEQDMKEEENNKKAIEWMKEKYPDHPDIIEKYKEDCKKDKDRRQEEYDRQWKFLEGK